MNYKRLAATLFWIAIFGGVFTAVLDYGFDKLWPVDKDLAKLKQQKQITSYWIDSETIHYNALLKKKDR